MNGNLTDTNAAESPVAGMLPPEQRYVKKKRNRFITVFQWAVIIVAGSGFIYKFIEFTISIFKTGNELVNFAVTPLVMYVSVAIGFFLMFLGTVFRGDYKDIERPRFRLFERELELDIMEREQEEQRKQKAHSEILSMPISKN